METHLSKYLLRLFARGELTGTQVQALALSASQDGWGRTCPLAKHLINAGSRGTNSSHVLRDIIDGAEKCGIFLTSAKPYKVDLPDGAGALSVFLPHEVYPKLVAGSDLSDWCMSADDLDAQHGLGPLLKGWSEHRDVQFTGDLSKVGILGFHCDGVSYTTTMRAGGSRGILVAAMNVVSPGDDKLRNRRQPLFVIRKARLCNCGCSGFHTLQVALEAVAWSMRCLLSGVSPARRHDDSPWTPEDQETRMTAGLRIPHAALLQVRGDWEWLVLFCRLRSYSSDSFCWMCEATKSPGPLCYTSFMPDAAHRATLISHNGYLLACAREEMTPSNIFNCPGLLLDHLAVDSMHAGDLGSFQDAVGSLFWVEITTKAWHRNRAVGLARLNTALNLFYTANRDRGFSKLTPLVLSQLMAKDPGYPYLKAKAAQTRHVAEFAAILARTHMHGNSTRPPFQFLATSGLAGRTQEHLQNLVDMCEGMAAYHRACSSVPFEHEPCRRAMYQFLQSLAALNTLWRSGLPEAAQKKQPFHLRQKAHVLQHLVVDKLHYWGSPSRSWCYRDEDYVGAVKVIAGKTKHPHTLELRVNQKLMILAGLDACV
jgi:hypothetical protein